MTLEDVTPLPPLPALEVFQIAPPRRHPILGVLQKLVAVLAILALTPLVILIGAFSLACRLDDLVHRQAKRLAKRPPGRKLP